MSTMTPDKRADELADWLLDNGRVPIMTRDSRERIAAVIREAEEAAVARCREIVRNAKVDPEASAEHLRHLIVTALDPRWDEITRRAIASKRKTP